MRVKPTHWRGQACPKWVKVEYGLWLNPLSLRKGLREHLDGQGVGTPSLSLCSPVFILPLYPFRTIILSLVGFTMDRVPVNLPSLCEVFPWRASQYLYWTRTIGNHASSIKLVSFNAFVKHISYVHSKLPWVSGTKPRPLIWRRISSVSLWKDTPIVVLGTWVTQVTEYRKDPFIRVHGGGWLVAWRRMLRYNV